MAIEHLDEDLALPYNAEAILSKDKKRFNDYVKQLIGELERIQLKDIRERINILIDLSGAGNIIYLGTKDGSGDYPNGTWRLNGSSATEYLIQLKEAGTWNTKGDLDSAALATYVNLVLTGLTASRLTATDANKQIVSADIVAWIAGTLNQITVTDDGDGTVTLSLPQNIHTGASPTFVDVTISNTGLTTTDMFLLNYMAN